MDPTLKEAIRNYLVVHEKANPEFAERLVTNIEHNPQTQANQMYIQAGQRFLMQDVANREVSRLQGMDEMSMRRASDKMLFDAMRDSYYRQKEPERYPRPEFTDGYVDPDVAKRRALAANPPKHSTAPEFHRAAMAAARQLAHNGMLPQMAADTGTKLYRPLANLSGGPTKE
jgi:hypothetical protein